MEAEFFAEMAGGRILESRRHSPVTLSEWQTIVALRLAQDQLAFFRSFPQWHLPGLSEMVTQQVPSHPQ